MANGPLYKKYGGFSAPGMALIEGQKAVGDSFKEALGSIDALLKDTEEKYRQENTLNMQEYLKSSLKKAGLGADPVNREAIRQRFGSLINMDQVDETIKGTTEEMTSNALDQAYGAAGKAFAQTEDMAGATDALRQSLAQAGMRNQDISKHVQSWTEDNQFLPENIKIRDQNRIDNTISQFYATLAANPDKSDEEIQRELIDSAPEKLRAKLHTELNRNREDWYKLDEMSKMDVALAHQRIDDEVNTQNAELDLRIQQEKENLKLLGGVMPGTRELTTQLSSQLGGVPKAMADASEKGFWSSLAHAVNPFDGNNEFGADAARVIQERVQRLKGMDGYRDLDMETALAIGIQSYNDFGADGEIDPQLIDERMAQYATEEIQKQERRQTIQQMEQAALKEQQRLRDKATLVKHRILRKEQRSHLGNDPYDPIEASSSWNSPGDSESIPSKEAPKSSEDVSKEGTNSLLSNARIEERVKQNRQLAGGAKTPSAASTEKPAVSSLSGQNDAGDAETPWYEKAGGTNLINLFTRARDKQKQALSGIKVPGIDERVERLRSLSRSDQKTELARLEKRIGKSLTDQVRAGLNEETLDKPKVVDGLNPGEKVTLAPSVLQGLAKIPSTDASVRDMANRLKVIRKKEDWPKVIKAIRAGNPELADKLAKFLKMG